MRGMGDKLQNASFGPGFQWSPGILVPKRVIRRYAQAIAERFQPEKIILFGSYAYGQPNGDSDVDLLVVMPARNQLDQAFKIRLAVSAPFPMDLIVRTPKNLKNRLKDGDSFHTEIVSRGQVLYEKGNERMGTQGRGRSHPRKKGQSRSDSPP